MECYVGLLPKELPVPLSAPCCAHLVQSRSEEPSTERPAECCGQTNFDQVPDRKRVTFTAERVRSSFKHAAKNGTRVNTNECCLRGNLKPSHSVCRSDGSEKKNKVVVPPPRGKKKGVRPSRRLVKVMGSIKSQKDI